MVIDWKIHPPAKACSVTGRAFEEGESFFSLLENSKEGLSRRDFCLDAWSQRNDNIRPISFWRGEFKIPPPPPPEPVTQDKAETVLRELMEKKEPGSKNAIYILGVMLERKRIFKQVDVTEMNGSRMLVYEHQKNGETFLIEDPQLKLTELEAVQNQVAQLLDAGSNA